MSGFAGSGVLHAFASAPTHSRPRDSLNNTSQENWRPFSFLKEVNVKGLAD